MSRLVDSGPIAIVHGSEDDGLPNSLRVHGVITELTFADAYCGGITSAGTLKIKLLNKIDSYPYENVFVMVTCFLDSGKERDYLNKKVSVEVGKLYGKKDGSCYFEIVTNRIDSTGIPFYCTVLSQDEILKIIEQENQQ